MKVLVLCDDYWHPARTVRAGLQPLETEGLRFDWIEDSATWSAERMRQYPVVVLSKSNNVSAADQTPWMTEDVEVAFADHVGAGGGLIAIHSGTAGYAETPVLRALLGGVFTHHPKQCPVTVTPHPNHHLTGCAPFTAQDEHYFMALDDPEADVFITTTSEHGTQPGGWTRTQGNGRVCVLTPGHNEAVWLEASYQTLIANALHWCAGRG